MGIVGPVIHANAGIGYQVKYAQALRAGFAAHGIQAEISTKADTPGTLHVVMGPHFAFERWKYHNTLYIDRAYWGDPDSVSVHWLRGGEKLFEWCLNMPPRPTPELQPMRTGPDRLIYLCDYGKPPQRPYDAFRRHPTETQDSTPLAKALEGFTCAAGQRTTALVDAAIMGLHVYTTDTASPVWAIGGPERGPRDAWLKSLAWHNWHIEEIEQGLAWDHLSQLQQPRACL